MMMMMMMMMMMVVVAVFEPMIPVSQSIFLTFPAPGKRLGSELTPGALSSPKRAKITAAEGLKILLTIEQL
jgi:hypothetical protein